MAKSLAPHRLVDTDSGGGANNLHIGDVNDIHSCAPTEHYNVFPENQNLVPVLDLCCIMSVDSIPKLRR